MDQSQLQQHNRQLTILNTIARELNREVELRYALSVTLRHTIELLDLTTGWIWLVQPTTQSVYLAASHNLPPGLRHHPERLSGWCYCIDKYLADRLSTATNISEITCSRLQDLTEGTAGLRYHASVPLFADTGKIGIMNLVSPHQQQLTEEKLALLHTIGDLLSIAIQRARLYEASHQSGAAAERQRLGQVLLGRLAAQLDTLHTRIHATQIRQAEGQQQAVAEALGQSLQLIDELRESLRQSADDLNRSTSPATAASPPLQYPQTPLSERELEVLRHLKAGATNKLIAAALFISERTVKFHVSAILSKLDAGNRTEAVQRAVERGMLER